MALNALIFLLGLKKKGKTFTKKDDEIEYNLTPKVLFNKNTMKKYINKDALMVRIKKLKMDIGNIFNKYDEGFWEGRSTAFDDVICAINTFEVKEVDLNKEIGEYLSTYWPNEKDLHPFLGHVAKHFFELGLSHSVNESIVRKVIDLYFEASKHYDEVIKQERNENGGSQLAIDILNGSKDMKELCVQYVLDKVTKE